MMYYVEIRQYTEIHVKQAITKHTCVCINVFRVSIEMGGRKWDMFNQW